MCTVANLSDNILQITDKILLSDFIGRDVTLKLKGREYVGCCPFHVEKTGSFYISDEKGMFHCFGCGISGNIFTYVMKRDGITFPQALKKLADFAGIELQKLPIKKHDELYKTLELAKQFFESNKSEIAGYLKKRELNNENIYETFHLGYAPNNNELYKHLLRQGCSENDMINSGLFTEKYNNKFYPRFKNRLMFSICDSRNRVIAFGGRAIDDSIPKYLNSTDTPLFHKHEVLYAFNIAKEHVSVKNPFIVVEGYIDVITMHKYGYSTTVGTMGTALSIEHLRTLWKYSDEPIICMDGDNAGQKAMNRIAHLALEVLTPGKSLKFISLSDDLDPDTYLHKYGSIKTLRAIALNNFLWQEYLKELRNIEQTPEKIALWEQKIFKDCDSIKDITIKRLYKKKFSNNIYNLRRNKNSNQFNIKFDTALSSSEQMVIREYVLSYILVLRPNIIPSVSEKLSCISFSDRKLKNFWNSIMSSNDITVAMEKALADEHFINEIVKEGQKVYRINNQSDEELLSDWLYIFDKVVSAPLEQEDLVNAKNEFSELGSKTAWERLKALKIYSLNKRNDYGK